MLLRVPYVMLATRRGDLMRIYDLRIYAAPYICSYGSEQIWTCMVIPSTIIVTACAVVAQSTSLGHLYMPQVRWREYQNGFTGNIYLFVREKIL